MGDVSLKRMRFRHDRESDIASSKSDTQLPRPRVLESVDLIGFGTE